MAADPENTPYLFDRPRNIKRLLYGLFAVCALLLALDFVIHRHATHPWESLPGFYALYGFGAYVLLVLIAKLLRRVLMRAEDYYAPDIGGQDEDRDR